MQNIPWGLQITAIGMGMVFLMLLILMGSLMIMTGLDKPPAEIEEADETPAIEAAPLAAAAATGGMSDAELAAIAVAIHTAQAGGNAPALVANQSGSGLTDSRWVAVGRSLHTTTWQRS